MPAYSPRLTFKLRWLLPAGLLLMLPWLLGAAPADDAVCDRPGRSHAPVVLRRDVGEVLEAEVDRSRRHRPAVTTTVG